jgi:ABC-2 type transport system ATP-binding protein
MNPLAVNIDNLTFGYPGNSLLLFSNFNLKIAEGERFGLFGPNGAGKTTLMNLMTGLLSASKGSIKLLGNEIKKYDTSINKLFGYIPHDLAFYQELNATENLEFFGAWSGLKRKEIKTRTNELLGILGLAEVRNVPVKKFSDGMKRRVNLAIGVIQNSKILFLDEPTVGVDVQTRFAIINYLKELNKNGTTLIYTSHQLSEAEGLCDKVALIDEGKIIAHDDLNVLLTQYSQEGLEGLFLNLTGKNYRNL